MGTRITDTHGNTKNGLPSWLVMLLGGLALGIIVYGTALLALKFQTPEKECEELPKGYSKELVLVEREAMEKLVHELEDWRTHHNRVKKAMGLPKDSAITVQAKIQTYGYFVNYIQQ